MRLPTKDVILATERKPALEHGKGTAEDGTDRNIGVVTAQQEKIDNFTYYKRVADYLLGKTIGEGSFAKVRLGLHVPTAQEVAVKIINKAKASKDAYVHKNLRREGRILQMARHQNIIQVYDVLETYNNYYLVTEYCGGGELIDVVTERGGLPEANVKKYVSQLVSAVAHLHGHGIVHRDLKVENLILDEFGDLKVIDFGLSNVVADVGNSYGALSTQCGSPAYAAPELLAKKAYGPNVDVWSIGVITYAMIVGKLPFTAEPFRIPVLCRKMMAGEMNPLPSYLSNNCRNFIKRLMTPEPKSRPSIQQVQEMPWLESTIKPGTFRVPNGQQANPVDNIDNHIVSEMVSKHGFEFTKVSHCVRKNRPGEALTMYFLLCKHRRLCQKASHKELNDLLEDDKNTQQTSAFNESQNPDPRTVTQNQTNTVSNCDQPARASTFTEESHKAPVMTTIMNRPRTSDEAGKCHSQMSCPNGIPEIQNEENLTTTITNRHYDQNSVSTDKHSVQRKSDMQFLTCELPKDGETHTHSSQRTLQLTYPEERAKPSSSHNCSDPGKARQSVPEITNFTVSTNDNKHQTQASSGGIRHGENSEKVVKAATDVKRSSSDFGSCVSQSTLKQTNTPEQASHHLAVRNVQTREALKLSGTWSHKSVQNAQNRSVSPRRSSYHPISVSKRSAKISPVFTSIFHRHRQTTDNPKAVNSQTDCHVHDGHLANRRSGTALPVISVQISNGNASQNLLRNEPRYKSKAIISREMTKSLRNRGSVREMIEKFDGMTENDPFLPRQISPVAVYSTQNHTASQDKKHCSVRTETTETIDKLQHGRIRNPLNQRHAGKKYPSRENGRYIAGKHDNSTFISFFRSRSRELRLGKASNRSVSPAKDTKQPVRGVWYRSLV